MGNLISNHNCLTCMDDPDYCDCGKMYKALDNEPQTSDNIWKSSLDKQVDGDHYKRLEIQPAYYSYKNGLNWHQGEIVKYISRYKFKNGIVDLEKAIHLIEMLIELENGEI